MLIYRKKHSIKKFFFLTGFLLLVSANLSAVVFVTKPYLQNPSSDGMTVMWETSSNCFSWVEYGTTTSSLTSKAEASSCGLKQAYNKLNKIRLTNLTPGTTYYYRVCSKEITNFQPYSVTYGNTIYSSVFSFITSGIGETTTKMVILNDLHEGVYNGISSFTTLLGLVKTTDYDFVFLNGDILNHVEGEDQALNYMVNPCTDNFATTKPFMSSIGNHEKRGVFARSFCDYLSLPDDDKTYYTFTRGPVFFIVLDTGEDKEDSDSEYSGLADFDAYREEQAVWLEKQLNSVACKAAKYKIVLMHIPPYWSGCYASTHLRGLFNPMFNSYKIDMVIAGHTHVSGLHLATESTDYKYPILIGGGPAVGARSIIKLTATGSMLMVRLINDSGTTLDTYMIAPQPTSLQTVKSNSLKMKSVTDKILTMEGLPQEKECRARVYSFLGDLLMEASISSTGTIDISGLDNRIYLVSVLEKETGMVIGNIKFNKTSTH